MCLSWSSSPEMWVNVLWSGVVWFAAVEINRDGTGRGDGSVSGPGWLGGATMGQMGQMVWILSRKGSWTLVTAFIVAMFFGGRERVPFSGFEALISLQQVPL